MHVVRASSLFLLLTCAQGLVVPLRGLAARPCIRLPLRPCIRQGTRRTQLRAASAAAPPATAAQSANVDAAAPKVVSRWGKLASLVGSDGPIIVAAGVSLILAALADVAVPHFSSKALNAVVAGDAARASHQLAGLGAACLLGAAFTGLRGGLFWLAGVRVVSRLRVRMFSAMLRQDLGWFDETSTGSLNSRLSSDATRVADVVSFNLNILARQSIQALGGVAYLCYLDGRLAALTVAFMGLASVFADVYGRASRRFAKDTQDRLAASAAIADESLRNVRVARSLAAEPRLAERYASAVDGVTRVQTRHGLWYGVSRLALGSAKGASSVATLAYGAQRVAVGAMTGDQLVTFLFYAAYVSNAAFDVGDQWAKVEEALGAGAEAFKLAYRAPTWTGAAPPSSLVDDAAPPKARNPARGAVAFDDVSFSYPARPDEAVLGRYEASSGVVSLDGDDVRDVAMGDLCERVAYVEQEPSLFGGTIADNIRFGLDAADPRASDAAVRAAAEAAGVDEFADRLPRGLDTEIGADGVFQSGGQKQRIAIARALVRDPALIVLDEPSSALDAKSEALVQRALDATTCSMLVVAHRLATIYAADRIFVLSKGEVVEEGTHVDLMARNGEYASMVRRQSFEEAKENVAATPAEFVSDDGADVPAEAPREEATNDLVAAPPPLTEAR
ncbi:ATPase [Aureococcus anophagefferens]|nr:ATPase [Aureococcus anophagefferens]